MLIIMSLLVTCRWIPFPTSFIPIRQNIWNATWLVVTGAFFYRRNIKYIKFNNAFSRASTEWRCLTLLMSWFPNLFLNLFDFLTKVIFLIPWWWPCFRFPWIDSIFILRKCQLLSFCWFIYWCISFLLWIRTFLQRRLRLTCSVTFLASKIWLFWI